MKLNWNFLGVGGAKQKPFHGGSMDFFLELHNCTISVKHATHIMEKIDCHRILKCFKILQHFK